MKKAREPALCNQERKRLGDYLIEADVIDEETLNKALEIQKEEDKRLGQILIDMGATDDEGIAGALAEQLRIPLIRLKGMKIPEEAISLVPAEMAQANLLIPISTANNKLQVAMVDPLELHAIDDLRFLTGMRIDTAVTPQSDLFEAFWVHYPQKTLQKLLDSPPGFTNGLKIVTTIRREDKNIEDLLASTEAPPVVRLVNTILADAFRLGASDIHVQPRRSEVFIRYRVDGVMREIMRLGRHVHAALISRLKVISNMDISIRRKPQDGKAQVTYQNNTYDLRIATIPTSYDERVNIRILDQSRSVTLEDLGLAQKAQSVLRDAIKRPQGIILVTGPTGSGKSTTLYACLKELDTATRNIMTVEDPIEYDMPGIDQVEINPKAGLTFATGLRSILRHDPDIVMVGEIRDQETASIALQAAMTGHLVFATLHTNDAPSAVSRLKDLGGEPFIISNVLTCVIGQRLVRRICDRCKEPDPLGLNILKRTQPEFDGLSARAKPTDPEPGQDVDQSLFLKGKGCETCQFTGYSGRIGIFEVLGVTPSMGEIVASEVSSQTLKRAAEKEGFQTMALDGIGKALEGITTVDEVFRVAPPESEQISHMLPPEPVATEQAGSVEKGRSVEQLSLGSIRPKKILVVDDDDVFLRVVQTILETENYQVIAALDGEEALKLAMEEKPDLIIADLRLPGIDGIELVKKLKSQLSTRLIPAIMLTIKDDLDSEIRGLESGADDYLTKPIQPERLLARVKRFLNRE